MKTWRIIGLVVLAGVVIGGGWTGYSRLTKANTASSGSEGQVVEAKRGDLEMTISASGSVVAPRQAKLSFESAGTILELSVEVGDKVQKGQVLARLETSSLERAVAQAEAGLKSAQINLEKARKPYNEIDFARAEAAVAQAEAGLKSAQINLEEAQDLDNAIKAVLNARAALKTAQDSLKNTQELYDENGIADAQAAVRNAEVALEIARQDLIIIGETHAKALRAAQETLDDEEEAYIDLVEAHYGSALSREDIYKPLKEQTGYADRLIPDAVKDAYKALLDTKSDFEIANAQAAKAIADAENSVAKAGDSLRNAQKDLAERLKGGEVIAIEIKELQVESARISLQEAEADLAKIKEGTGSRNVQLKRIQLDNARLSLLKAKEELAEMKAGPDPLDIELKEIQVSKAQTALSDAKEKLEKATMTAPFDGLVASVNNKVGDRVGANAVIVQLIDPGEFEVEAILDELDVNQVRPGQAVQVSLDALPRARLEGKVKAISPLAQREAGVISYKAIISIPPPGRIPLKDGLTASAEIVVARRQNVLLVPSRAVSRSGRDRTVQVMVDGQPQERTVRTGLSQDGQTEILSGLSEGEKVLMPAATSSQPQAPASQRRGGMFFGPRGGRR